MTLSLISMLDTFKGSSYFFLYLSIIRRAFDFLRCAANEIGIHIALYFTIIRYAIISPHFLFPALYSEYTVLPSLRHSDILIRNPIFRNLTASLCISERTNDESVSWYPMPLKNLNCGMAFTSNFTS